MRMAVEGVFNLLTILPKELPSPLAPSVVALIYAIRYYSFSLLAKRIYMLNTLHIGEWEKLSK